jgi:hypothetical protein
MKCFNFSKFTAALATMGMLSACATGPAFTGPEIPAAGQAVIYVYRLSQLPGAGIKHQVLFGSQKLGHLVSGSYVRIASSAPRLTDPFLTGCMPLSQPLYVEAGKTYYVQAVMTNKTAHYGGKPYFDFGCVLVTRSEAEALLAITGLPRAD